MATREQIKARNERLAKTPAGRALFDLLSKYDANIELASALGVGKTLVEAWVAKGRVSSHGAILIEQKLGVPRATMRPDIDNWDVRHGKPIGAKAVHDNDDQKLLADLAAHFGSVKSFCHAIGITVVLFHNWKSRGRIPGATIKRLMRMDLPADILDRLREIPA